MAETVLHVVSEDVQTEHVAKDMHPAAVEKHEGDERGDLADDAKILPGPQRCIPGRNQAIKLVKVGRLGRRLEKDKEVDDNEGGVHHRHGPGRDGVSQGDHGAVSSPRSLVAMVASPPKQWITGQSVPVDASPDSSR